MFYTCCFEHHNGNLAWKMDLCLLTWGPEKVFLNIFQPHQHVPSKSCRGKEPLMWFSCMQDAKVRVTTPMWLQSLILEGGQHCGHFLMPSAGIQTTNGTALSKLSSWYHPCLFSLSCSAIPKASPAQTAASQGCCKDTTEVGESRGKQGQVVTGVGAGKWGPSKGFGSVVGTHVKLYLLGFWHEKGREPLPYKQSGIVPLLHIERQRENGFPKAI